MTHGWAYEMREKAGTSMGATPINEGPDTDAAPAPVYTDKADQSSVQPSKESCFDVIAELKSERPSGKPLLELAGTGDQLDLSKILFKQENEGGGIPEDQPTDPESLEVGDTRPGLYGHRSGFMNDRAETTEDARFVEKPSYFEAMKEVFGNSKYFDVMRNHNQVLSTPGDKTITQLMDEDGKAKPDDVHGHRDADGHSHRVDEAQLASATAAIQEKPDVPTTLLNFDSHSDMWLGPVAKNDENIAQWVNGVLRENPNIKDVYWVLPQDFKDNPDLKDKYFDQPGVSDPSLGDHVFVHTQPDSTLYFNTETAALSGTRPEGYSEDDPKYRMVNLHKRTLDDLPDFEGQRTAVSIDLDFFDNRGYDTSYSAQVNYQGDEGFGEFVQKMKEQNIRPDYTTVSASPEYVRSEHIRELLRFSSLVGEATGNPTDGIAVPRENEINGLAPHEGIQVERGGIPGLELTGALFSNDSRTQNPNDSLNLNVPSEELAAAIAATKQIYKTGSAEEATNVLQRLDSADGNANGTLEFEAIESLLVRVCKAGPDKRLSTKNPDGN